MVGIYTTLSKYKSTKNISPLENFTTEAFCHLLEYSQEKNTELLIRVVRLFGIDLAEKDYSNLKISTQKQFTSILFDKKVQPDISLEINEQLILIEVKIDSRFNKYKIGNKEINQIELYQDVKGAKVFSLTKRALMNSLGIHNSKFWFDIYELLQGYSSDNKIETYLFNEFMQFMEDHDMNISKIEKDNQSLINISHMIDQSLKALKSCFDEAGIKNPKYFYEPENAAVGFYYDGGTEKYICIYYDDPDYIRFQLNEKNGEKEFFMDNDFFDLTATEQVVAISNRFREEL